MVREVDGGVERVALALPGGRDLRAPAQQASLRLAARHHEGQEEADRGAPAASLLGVDLAPRVVVRRLAEPPARKGGVKVADVDELWKKLHEEAKVV